MRRMTTPKIYLCAFLLLLLILLSWFGISASRGGGADTAGFVQSEEAVSKAVSDAGLSWEHQSTQSLGEGSQTYTFAQKDSPVSAYITTLSVMDMRSVNLQLRYTPDNVEHPSIKALSQSELKQLFQLACTLFGAPEQQPKLLRALSGYLRGRNSGEYGAAYWSNNADGIFCEADLLEARDAQGYYVVAIRLMNQPMYEAFLRDNMTPLWKNNLRSEKVELLENASVSNLTQGSDRSAYVVQGSLQKIQRADDLSGIQIPGWKATYPKDVYSAVLVDATGEIPVLVRVGALTKADLQQERTHCVSYYPDCNAFFVVYSAVS